MGCQRSNIPGLYKEQQHIKPKVTPSKDFLNECSTTDLEAQKLHTAHIQKDSSRLDWSAIMKAAAPGETVVNMLHCMAVLNAQSRSPPPTTWWAAVCSS